VKIKISHSRRPTELIDIFVLKKQLAGEIPSKQDVLDWLVKHGVSEGAGKSRICSWKKSWYSDIFYDEDGNLRLRIREKYVESLMNNYRLKSEKGKRKRAYI